MAMAFLGRTLITKPTLTLIFSRSFTVPSLSGFRFALASRSSSHLLRLRPLVALPEFRHFQPEIVLRCFATHQTSSSSPPKETTQPDGCDFEHWLIVMDGPKGEPERDEIIDSYIKTLATVLGSEDVGYVPLFVDIIPDEANTEVAAFTEHGLYKFEEEARKSIYSVSTRHYYAFGCIVSEEISHKIKELPGVRWALPDSYMDAKNKDYGGEPFIDGKAVPYDPKYHEQWVKNNARYRRNDRPFNFDRSRNLERKENMQNRDFQSREMPPMPNRDKQNPVPYVGGMQPNRDAQNSIPNMGGGPPDRDMHNSMLNMGGMPNRDAEPNAGWCNNMPNRNAGNMPTRDFQNRDGPYSGGMPNQSREMPSGAMPNRDYQSSYTTNRDMACGIPYQV
ncbi:hypothetical protein HHK36_003577 [Tetracentron sinense]|uniref:MORF/ORRM1/DAG-like MORF domain-containing protein n=1 Tax=Tetracentron sinense TaxID=13715 RepID=A0A834ZTN3_TETSI|nr:hypothetical protein HHK36_003577 [Tetracentron sinense]